MVDFGTLFFQSARESGVFIDQLSSGTYDHLGFFGPNGETSAVEIGSFQDTTIIVDDTGNPNPVLGPFGGSGYLTNNKLFPDTSGTRISGLPEGPFDAAITDVNVFDPANLGIAPDFVNRPSGTLLVRYVASGTSLVQTFNAKIFAYDNAGTILDAPPDVNVFAYEINASGIWFNQANSGIWVPLQGQNNALTLANHSTSNGYQPANTHLFVCGITAKANAVGILDQWDIAFQLQFAGLLISAGLGISTALASWAAPITSLFI